MQELAASIEKTKDGYAASVACSLLGDRKLLALTEGKALQATSIRANTPSHLRDAVNAADFVIVSDARLAGSLKPLVELRRQEELITVLVDIEDIYDEFSFGAKSPQAVKDFLACARGSWHLAPRFVLFAGDASFDPRNYLGAGDFDFVPTRLIDTAYLETASDDWFVDFNDDGFAEMYLGRLPVRTASEGAALISKIINYEGNVKSSIARRSVLQDPVTESLAEALLKSERGGAIAVWASSGLTEPAEQAVMNQQAYRLLFAGGSGLTIGEGTSRAEASISNIDIRRTWILFGDPTTRPK